MESFECNGLFWLANEPDFKLPGRLVYKGHGGVDLNLFGSLDRVLPQFIPTTEDILLINGMADGKKWSLYKPLLSKRNLVFPGLDEETYHSAIVVAGNEFFDISDFDQLCGVDIQMDYLFEWIGRSGLEFEFEIQEGSDQQIRVEDVVHSRITHKPLPEIAYSMPDGEIKIKFLFTTNNKGEQGILSECIVKQKGSLGFKWKSTVTINKVLEYAKYFRNLLTISIGVPPKIFTVNVLKPGSQGSFDLYTSGLINLFPNRPRVNSLNRAFTLNSLGGIKTLSNWLQISQKYDTAINALLSHKYVPDLYEENKFVNIIIAIEAFAKAQNSDDNLEHILKHKIEKVGEIFKNLVGDTDNWITETVIMRNDIIHSQRLNNLDYKKLQYLIKTSYWLIIIWLLRECQVSGKVLDDLWHLKDFELLYKERLF